MEKLIQVIRDWFSKLNGDQKKRLALAGTILFAAILTISVLISIEGSGKEENLSESERVSIYSPIPAQELFLPDEPDFIPVVLPERGQRTDWSDEDSAEYWQDPLRYGEEMWRDKIEAAVDDLLERIP